MSIQQQTDRAMESRVLARKHFTYIKCVLCSSVTKQHDIKISYFCQDCQDCINKKWRTVSR